jgi:hypothetical protein
MDFMFEGTLNPIIIFRHIPQALQVSIQNATPRLGFSKDLPDEHTNGIDIFRLGMY